MGPPIQRVNVRFTMATIPDYQTLMLPLLRFLGDGRERSFGEAVEAIAVEFHLTTDDRQRLLPTLPKNSGRLHNLPHPQLTAP